MRTVLRRRLLFAVGCLLLAGGCGGGNAPAPASTSAPPPVTTTTAAPTTTVASRDAAPVVVLDPGHNSGNASHPAAINRQVPAGRGRMKDCNTTGTSTGTGYPEHAFNFDVAGRVARILERDGVRVLATRTTDDGVGPCVDDRAAAGNRAEADAVVSIHADGSTAAGARGFHIAYSAPPLNEAQTEPAPRLARAMRSAFTSAGFPTANYLGENGLSGRDDLAGLNLSRVPAVLVECGNMRNPAEAAAMSTPQGRQRYAEAIARGALAYLRS